MEETYNIKAIILNRRPFSEDDGRVAVYSLERGKLELTVRGLKKIKSKLAGHLEPLNLADIMVARGRAYDYVGTAVSENCYGGIKRDLEKLNAAGQAVKMVDKLIKPGVADKEIFGLLADYLAVLNSAKSGFNILNSFFIFKFLAKLGHKPEMYSCVNCGKKIKPGSNKFDLAKGGLVCGQCSNPKTADQLTISDDGIKLLRLADKYDLNKLVKIKINKKIEKEIGGIISKFNDYIF